MVTEVPDRGTTARGVRSLRNRFLGWLVDRPDSRTDHRPARGENRHGDPLRGVHRGALEMMKRKTPRRRRRWMRRPNAYRRLEAELANARDALGTAATKYTETLQALIDLLGYYDRPDG